MPPHLFRSNVARYQEDTDTVVDWLLRTSRYVSHGAEDDDHETLRNKFSCREFVHMAEAISYLPTMSVPSSLIRLLRSTIQARRRCAEWFRAQLATPQNSIVNTTHMYFINTLQAILKILLPLSDSEEGQESARPPLRKRLQPYVTSVVDEDDTSTTKSYGTHSDEGTVATADVTEFDMPDAREEGPEVSQYGTKMMSKKEDRLFLCFCVLEELNKLRQSIRGYWLAYNSRQMSLAEASLLTQTTLDIARKCIEDFEHSEEGGAPVYKAVFIDFFLEKACELRQPATKSGKQREDRKSDCWEVKSMAEITDWIFLGAWDALSRGNPPCDWKKLGMNSPKLHDFPFPLQYKVQKDSDTEGGCPGSQLVWEYLTLTVPRHYSSGMKRSRWFEDNISLGFDKLYPCTHEVNFNQATLYTIFTTQILLDMHEQLSETGFGRCASEVDAALSHSKDVWSVSERVAKNCSRDKDYADFWKEGYDLAIEMQESCVEIVHRYGYSRNPLQAGLTCFYMKHHRYRWGTMFADYHNLSLVKAIHVYNAARQEGTVDESWADMDFIIQMHTPEYLFGGGFPTDCSQYIQRFRAAIGVTYRGNKVDLDKIRELNLHTTKILRFLDLQSIQSAEQRCDGLEALQVMVTVSKAYGTGTRKLTMDKAAKINKADLHKLCAKLPTPGPSEFLEDLRKILHELMPEIHFDYFAFTVSCTRLERNFEKMSEYYIPMIAQKTQSHDVDVKESSFVRVFVDLAQYAIVRDALALLSITSGSDLENSKIKFKTSLNVAAQFMVLHIADHGNHYLSFVKDQLPWFQMEPVDFSSGARHRQSITSGSAGHDHEGTCDTNGIESLSLDNPLRERQSAMRLTHDSTNTSLDSRLDSDSTAPVPTGQQDESQMLNENNVSAEDDDNTDNEKECTKPNSKEKNPKKNRKSKKGKKKGKGKGTLF